MRNRFSYLRTPSMLSGLDIAALAGAYCAIAFWLSMLHGGFKVLIYAIPLVAFLAMVATRRFTLPPNAPPYLVLVCAALALAPLGTLAGLQDTYLMLMGLSPFFFGCRYRLTWNHVFFATLVATVLTVGTKGLGTVQFDPAKSSSPFEATTSFVFGVLVVWAAIEKRWRSALIALVLCILTLKRIVALGAMVSVVALLLPRRVMDRLLTPIPMILFNIGVLILVIMYTNGALDSYVTQLTGQSPNQFGMGRQQLYHYPVLALQADPIRFAFIGIGAGGIYDLMKGGWLFLSKGNLHNDSMKILIEYGGILWLVFFYTVFRSAQSFSMRVMMLFFNILLLTDNSLIYSYVIFSICLACVTFESNLQIATVDTRVAVGPRRKALASYIARRR